MNGEGEDAGVVYCEMQGRENMERSRTYLNFTREMYPGHCGYKVTEFDVSMLWCDFIHCYLKFHTMPCIECPTAKSVTQDCSL